MQHLSTTIKWGIDINVNAKKKIEEIDDQTKLSRKHFF